MNTRRAQVVLAVMFFTGLANVVSAQITPSADSYTNSATPTTNYGSKVLLDVDAASQISYIQFDLSSIPAGATVSQATLKLFVNSVTTGGSFNVDYVNASWTESTIDFSNAPPLGGNIASNVSVTTLNKNQYILINVTSALQAWLNGSETNNGIGLVANGTFNATFDSKENTGTSHPPELDVVYSSGTGTITGVLTNSGSGLTGGGTSGTLNVGLLNTCGTNQVLQWNGSSWVCASVATGTITGVNAGTALLGGGNSGAVTLNVDTSQVPLLAAANTFTSSQTVSGNLTATGVVTGSSYQIGGNLFDWGSFANGNAFLGFAGNTASTGTRDSGIGYGALAGNTSGANNTGVGAFALSANTTGGENAAMGAYALGANTTGTSNTASGDGALTNNTSGSYNTADGGGALISVTTGGYNTGSGYDALLYNTTGSENVAVGFIAGASTNSAPTTGSYDTFVGANANPGTQTNLTNATAIGANAQVTASNSLVLGSIAGVNNASASTNVGIGTTAPAYALDVHGTGNFTGLVTFASNQTFPGTGTITGVTAGTDLLGGGSSGSVTLNVDTTKVVTGVVAGADLTGGGVGGVQTLNLDTSKVPLLAAANTFTGNQTVNGNLSATGWVSGSGFQIGSVVFDSGSFANANAFTGFAGNTTATGRENTASGFLALASTTTGGGNTAAGNQSLQFNTTGNLNTAVGTTAMEANTSGGQNTAVGVNALFSNTTGFNNAALGLNALTSNTTGGGNVGVGYQALTTGTTGSNNTALGASAGMTTNVASTTGSSNTFLGAFANPGTATALNNATAIGANAQVTTSNAMVLGSISGVNTAGASTFVGIGTTAPTYLLHIGNQGGISYNNFLRVEGPASGSGNAISVGGNGDVAIDAPGVPAGRFVVKTNGIVAIGIPNPLGNPFQIKQGLGNALADGWATYSSRRWKTDIHPLTDALGKVERLRGVSYDLTNSGKHEIGLIAEEVGEVVPEVVTYEENGKDARGVDYSRLTALLIEAVKQQQKQIAAQQQQIAAQQSELRRNQHLANAQQHEIARLSRKLGVLEASLRTSQERKSTQVAATVAGN